jgi:hypothetical protein
MVVTPARPLSPRRAGVFADDDMTGELAMAGKRNAESGTHHIGIFINLAKRREGDNPYTESLG